MKYTIHLTVAFVVLILALSCEAIFAQKTAEDLIREAQAQKGIAQRPSSGDRSTSNAGSNTTSNTTSNDSSDEERAEIKTGLVNDADKAAQRGDYAEAIQLMREAISLGRTKKWKADMRKWIRELEIRLEKQTTAIALGDEGNAAYKIGARGTALALFRRALATDPNCCAKEWLEFAHKVEADEGRYEIFPEAPLRLRNDPEIKQLQDDWNLAKRVKERAERILVAIPEARKKPGADQGELNVRRIEALNQISVAKSNLLSAAINVKKFVETHD